MIWPEEAELEERFRRRFLLLLERAGRLRPETRERSFDRLSTTGSSPGATRASRSRRRSDSPPTSAAVSNGARYATRVVLAVGAVKLLDGGRVPVETAPEPRTGRSVLVMDRLDLVHALSRRDSRGYDEARGGSRR